MSDMNGLTEAIICMRSAASANACPWVPMGTPRLALPQTWLSRLPGLHVPIVSLCLSTNLFRQTLPKKACFLDNPEFVS